MLLIIILVVVLLGGGPMFIGGRSGWGAGYSYGPFGLILLVLVLLFLFGRLHL